MKPQWTVPPRRTGPIGEPGQAERLHRRVGATLRLAAILITLFATGAL